MKKTLCTIFCLCLAAAPAPACRYTVRDTGFVDIGCPPYQLFVYVDGNTSREVVSTVKAYAALADSNVRVALVDISAPDDHPALPAAVLVAPDGRSLALPGFEKDGAARGRTWRALEEIVFSPLRAAIVKEIVDAYAVILLVEGKDAAANRAAREAIAAATARVKEMMPSMEKPVGRPPHLMAIGPDGAARERVLLWSLGIDGPGAADAPRAAILYGRGRRMGPVLAGGSLSEPYLFNILRLVGADCECGIDRSRLQGASIPLRWDEGAREAAAKILGFDPESPMVKLEVSRIVAHSPAGGGGDPFAADPTFGYSEQVVSFSSEEISPEEIPPEESTPEEIPPLHREVLLTLAGLSLAVIAGGVFVVLRAGRRNR